MSRPIRTGFTLLELLVVIGIMGLLGTVSVSGFRGLKKGMEVRGTMQTVNEFVHSAYQRAVIDRVPVSIYLWNETVSEEGASSDSYTRKLAVVGHAVAVRRAGRVSKIDGNFLIDEFGDLVSETYRDEDGEEDDANDDYKDDPGRYLYRMKTDSFERSVVSSLTVRRTLKDYAMSRPNPSEQVSISAYAYYVKPDGQGEKVIGTSQWHVGDPYGFEIAELTLPKNYIFGSGNDYSEKISDPERAVDVIPITGAGIIAKKVAVSGLKLSEEGKVSYEKIGETEDPSQE